MMAWIIINGKHEDAVRLDTWRWYRPDIDIYNESEMERRCMVQIVDIGGKDAVDIKPEHKLRRVICHPSQIEAIKSSIVMEGMAIMIDDKYCAILHHMFDILPSPYLKDPIYISKGEYDMMLVMSNAF